MLIKNTETDRCCIYQDLNFRMSKPRRIFRFGLKMTCYDSIYPFGVLSEKGLTQL